MGVQACPEITPGSWGKPSAFQASFRFPWEGEQEELGRGRKEPSGPGTKIGEAGDMGVLLVGARRDRRMGTCLWLPHCLQS